MATVIYGGNKIIPAPLVSISKSYHKGDNGEIIGKLFNLTLTGTIVAWMGSPKVDGTFWTTTGYPPDEVVADADRLGAIQRKQEALRSLFKTEGLSFEIQSSAGCLPVKCNPRLGGITFAEGVWYDKCDYTITLETDELYGGPFAQEDTYLQYISDANEEWSIDTNEGSEQDYGIFQTYALTHTISAVGKRFYNDVGVLVKQPWEQAKTFVLSKLGFDSLMTTSSGVLEVPVGYVGWNHVRSENINKQGGSYAVTENWLLSSSPSTEDFSVSTSDGLDSIYKQVSIEGTVTGYDQKDTDMSIVVTKYDNAATKFSTLQTTDLVTGAVIGTVLNRAQTLSGITLNIVPITATIGRNPAQGTITYNYEYNTRPSNLISGAKSEMITVSDSLNGQAFAAVFVLGRAKGPVLQNLGTKAVSTRSLSVEAIFPPTIFYPSTINTTGLTVDYRAKLNALITAIRPTDTPCYQGPEESSYNITDSRYTFNTMWTFDRISTIQA